jgi:hypothetical protein
MTITEFIAKWRKVELKERSAAQEHFLDLCHVFDHPTPAFADPTGETFCFEKGAAKHGGGDGFADVWKRGFWGFEYKGRHKDLDAAYDQLLRYRSALENPPLLLVCDLDRIVIHTNFTGTVEATYDIPLESLAEPRNIEIMRAVFHNPEALRPGRTSAAVTLDAAARIGEIAAAMRERGLDPAAVAHFLDRIVFCLFAEDTRLLPDMVFSRIVEKSGGDPARFGKTLAMLFETMATGGDFGLETIRHFNGSLFDDRTVPDLTPDDVKRIAAAATLDWSAVDPSIFGTLFERGLDPAKRSQLGAHFTGMADIELVVGAVVMAPLRREWEETRDIITTLLTTGRKKPADANTLAKPLGAAAHKKARGEAASILHQFLTRLHVVKILDPACGSGNFLYVALLRLKDLEKETILFGTENGLGAYLPGVGPWQLHGIEINPYAHDLAQMTVWIGWLQWIRANGFGFPADPILRPLADNIRLMDAILAEDGEPDWPTVDFIIGNPPFLGGKMLRRELGDEYVDRLLTLWKGRIPAEADLCCYWFEKARAAIAANKCKRAGLLATQGIRGGANREVLKRIKTSGDIFWAESDRPWILDGANVHVSMVGFDAGEDSSRRLDGTPALTINANLTSAVDITKAKPLSDNLHIFLRPPEKGGKFDLTEEEALGMMWEPNPHGRPNSDVVRPWVNAQSLVQTRESLWIIDYPPTLVENDASCYDKPWQYVSAYVRPARARNRDDKLRRLWWIHRRSGDGVREVAMCLDRLIITPMVSKHRIFTFIPAIVQPDKTTYSFARSDDLFFGVLHSRFHEVWALAQGTQLREKASGFRYTPTTCFETFPFPPGVIPEPRALPPGSPLAGIAAAAKDLNDLRERWLNPPEWTRAENLEFPASVDGPWRRALVDPQGEPLCVHETGVGWTPRDLFEADRSVRLASEAAKRGRGLATARLTRLVARDAACAVRLKDRTLTKLYNARPAWLANCHAALDAAVAAAYGWPADLPDDAILERLLALNLAQASGRPSHE